MARRNLRIDNDFRWAVLFLFGLIGFAEQIIGYTFFGVPPHWLLIGPFTIFLVGAPTASALLASWRGISDGSDRDDA